jgi:peptidoglycan hydrolase FlgJ
MDTAINLNAISGSFSSAAGLLAGNAKAQETESRFGALVDGIRAGLDSPNTKNKETNSLDGSVASKSIAADPRLPGDYISSFKVERPTAADRSARPVGAAANAGQKGSIDKTSKLYEQALELESYFVKMMLSSMRETISKSELSGGNDFAGKMYNDMLYDELARDVTKSAGFGLADQVYLQLKDKA